MCYSIEMTTFSTALTRGSLRVSLTVPCSPHSFLSPRALTKGFALVAHEMLASPPLPFPCHMPR